MNRAAPGGQNGASRGLAFLLAVQNGEAVADGSQGNYELLLSGALDGRPRSRDAEGSKPLQLRHHMRLQGRATHSPNAVMKALQGKVTGTRGSTRAAQSVRPAP